MTMSTPHMIHDEPTLPHEDWILDEDTILSDGQGGAWHPGPVPFEPTRADTGLRLVDFTFELLDNDEVGIGWIETVKPGGSLEWQSETAIKGAGQIDVVDLGQEIDWLNVRIKIRAVVDSLVDDREVADLVPLGVFLPAAPVDQWTDDEGRVRTVELVDKLSILDQDIVTDEHGNPVTFAAAKGRNVIDLVKTLIHETGETTPAILPGNATVTSDIVWEIGTTRLQIINDLLAASGYSSLWCDPLGQYRAEEYIPPGDRPVEYESPVNPFEWGQGALVDPDFSIDKDIYAIPNRYVAISNGSGGDVMDNEQAYSGTSEDEDGSPEAMVSVAVNDDPSSPYSYPSRGRWITHTVTGVEAVSQADLDSRAKQGLAQLTSVAAKIEPKHWWLPRLSLNSAVRFVHEPSDTDLLCYVTKTSIVLSPNELCSTTLQEAMT